ncbi:hypothetical protein ASE66_24490 [Bosea sp. Root483D1]|uniref:hypothetical protein n=1 Tax=Bosea sp. Root483D1 TaxID=1736544 RepID=UPI00070AC561|nr:hypothetical protein [Bosea sp. Root483D1]KRE11678.1 hypothetical protein ASE66_24490 [Bosea sp. Root483D1]
MLKHLAPVLCLFIITPLIAEYLLGNVPTTWIVLLPVLSLLYGSGAVLIRELARKTGRGWPTIATLAFAYAVVEEAFATQSWFNPNFEGQRLLDYGYVEALGTSPSWIVFVVILHVAWSICTPIALTEVIFTKTRLEPWLSAKGICVVAGLFASSIAILMTHFIIKDQFVASPMQFAASASVAVALIVVAFVLFPPKRENSDAKISSGGLADTPPPWSMGALVLAVGSAFYMIQEFAPKAGIPAWITACLSLSLALGMLYFVTWSSRRSDWSDRHRFALASGAVLVYCWWGFVIEVDLYGTNALPGRVLLVCASFMFLVLTRLRIRALNT